MFLFVNKNLEIIRKVIYKRYGNNIVRFWGDRLGLYNPIKGDLVLLNKEEWRVFDLIKFKRFWKIKGDDKLIVDNFVRFGLISAKEKDVTLVETKPKDAEMYIKLTEGCNFCCEGCATSSDLIPPNEAVTLDIETIFLYLRRFVRSSADKGFKRIYIKWAGGEPLLYRPYTILMEGVEYLKKMQKQYKNLQINQIVLTNGVYLDKEKADFLKQNNIAISCSLWGTKKFQDLLRKPRNKSESYEKIINNIKYLMKIGAKFNINHVITSQNVEEFDKFITIMWDIDSPDYLAIDMPNKKPIPIGMVIYRHMITPTREVQVKQYETIEKGLRKGFAKILELINKGTPIQPLSRFDYLNLFNVSLRTCGSGVNYVAVGPLGATNCHEGLYKMKPNIQEIRNGEINLFDLVNKNNSITNNKVKAENITDTILLHGGQGCPRVTGEKLITKLYKNIYKELLSLEALRQIKLQEV